MSNFSDGVTVGAILGAAGLEAFKQFSGHLMKRRTDKADGRRKLVRDDLQSLASKIEPMIGLASKYYSKPSSEGVETAAQLRMSLKSFAMIWNSTNARIEECGEIRMSSGPLISLRQALTSQLDERRDAALGINDLELEKIFGAAAKAHEELSQVRFRMT